MKLRNLLFATMFACAFASCSSDDDPTIDPTPAEAADAYLNIAATAKGEQTKATTDENALEGEAAVKTLAVIVFQADGKRIGYQFATVGKEGDKSETFYQNEDGSYTLNTPVKVKAVNVDVYVVANVADNVLSAANTTTLFSALRTELNQDISSGLVMSSMKYSATAENLKDKTIEDPFFVNSTGGDISIQRVAARVQLTEVKVDFESEKEQLDVKGAILINVRTNSLLYADAFTTTLDFGTAGSQAFGYGEYGDRSYTGGLFVTSSSNIKNNSAFTKSISNAVLTHSSTTKSLQVTGNDAVYSYVMPNALTSKCQEAIDGDDNAYTLLSIYGEYTDNTGTKMEGTRYYTVRIGKDGVGTSPTGNVVRNYVYDVKATLTGSGSDSPVKPEAKAYINATINVVPWTFVAQTPSVD
mgnify:CR=1 FL=1